MNSEKIVQDKASISSPYVLCFTLSLRELMYSEKAMDACSECLHMTSLERNLANVGENIYR